MNTVKIGDKFEDKSYRLIEKAVNNGELGILNSSARIFRKKGYYSAKREKEIIFNLAIEVWLKGAERYSLLFLIECKSSNSKKVPVDDVEEFYAKVDQVAGKNVKAVMISDNSFQKGGLTFAKHSGMMLIEVNSEDRYNIILHRASKDNSIEDKEKNNNSVEEVFFKFIQKTLGIRKVEGLQKLSVSQIENRTKFILDKFNRLSGPIEINSFVKYLEKEYKLTFDFSKNLETVNGKQIDGFFDVENKAILIDNSIVKTPKFAFVLGHELGHFFLHSNLRMNQEVYNDFEDSHYDFFADKHLFTNDKHWIEWQANKFSVTLFLPRELFLHQLITYRLSIGINNARHIYLDKQPINQRDFYSTLSYLADYFGISQTAVKYRIEELGLITYEKRDDVKSLMRNIFNNLINGN